MLGGLTAIGPMAVDMYLPALPTLARELSTSAGMVQFTLPAFFVGLTLGQLFYGTLTDIVGRKRPLLVGLLFFSLASFGCVWAPSIEVLIVLRFLQGLGGCAGMVIARAMVRDLFEPQVTARVYSTLMLIMGLAPILAPLVGGQLLLVFGWQSIFGALAFYGMLCLFAAAAVLPETVSRVQPAGRLRRVLRNYRVLLKDSRFLGYALSASFSYAGMFSYIAASPFVFIELFSVSETTYGWIFGANAAGLISASQLNHRWLRRRDSDDILTIVVLVTALAGCALALVAAFELGGLVGILLPNFVFVASLGCTQPNALAGALAAHGERAGSASALMGAVQFTAATIAGAAVGSLHDGSALPMAAVMAVCGVLAFVTHRAWVVRTLPT